MSDALRIDDTSPVRTILKDSTVDGEEALRLGLVGEVVPDEFASQEAQPARRAFVEKRPPIFLARWGAPTWPPIPPTLGAPRGTRGAPRYSDTLLGAVITRAGRARLASWRPGTFSVGQARAKRAPIGQEGAYWWSSRAPGEAWCRRGAPARASEPSTRTRVARLAPASA